LAFWQLFTCGLVFRIAPIMIPTTSRSPIRINVVGLIFTKSTNLVYHEVSPMDFPVHHHHYACIVSLLP
jgi:hypothetical protein